MPHFSIAFQTDKPLDDYEPLAARSEELGFDGVSLYNDLLFQPAWLPLLEMARGTRRVRLGPAAVNPFTCHPLNIAGHIALLDEASRGRAYLGLARGAWLDRLGLTPSRPVAALSEAFQCVRRLLSGDQRPFEGRVFRMAGGQKLRWKVPRSDIPFLLGSWGQRTIEACLGLVEEVKLGGTANPSVVRQTLAGMRAAQSRAGAASLPGLVVGSVTVVDPDGARARQKARCEAALYLPVVARLDPSLQIEPDRLQRLTEAVEQDDFEGAGRLIPDALLDEIALSGTPAQLIEQCSELLEAGVSRIEFGTPHGLDPLEGMRLLGRQVIPNIRDSR